MAKQKVTRKLASLICADVAGYSRLMSVDEASTLAALKAHREDLIDPATSRYQGRLVGTAGDSLLIEFASVVEAVSCAVEIQNEMVRRNAALPDERKMLFRMGINLADVIVDGDELYGDGVNIAARLETLAEPGGICASRAVLEQIKNRLDLEVEDLGELSVKNIAEPVHAYRILIEQGRPTDQSPARATPPRPEEARGSIAVFPFDSLSADSDDAYLADGITAEIISMLSRVPDLRVASLPASFAYRGRPANVSKVVRDLKLRYVLTGNIRRAGDRIRVIAELSGAADGTQLWSHTYQRQLADLFAVQEEIAEAIVIAFGGEYLRAEWRRAGRRPTESLDAWGLVQKAKSLNLPVNRDSMDEALDLARKAVEIDPAYGGAQAGLGSILMQRVINGIGARPEEDRAEALAAAERATELSPDDPTVLRTLGNVLANCGEYEKAVRALRRAVEIAPFDFHSWGRLGRTLAYGGDADDLREGQAVLDRILATAPDHPMVPYWHSFKANACARQERYEDAVLHARKSLETQPGYAGAWVTLANALGQLGRKSEAQQAMDRALRANPAMTPDHLAAQIRISAGGHQDRAENTLAGLKAAGLL